MSRIIELYCVSPCYWKEGTKENKALNIDIKHQEIIIKFNKW